MEEARVIDLETRLAYQEAGIQALSDAIAAQQKQIEQLERTCRWLLERVRTSAPGPESASASEEVPPHY